MTLKKTNFGKIKYRGRFAPSPSGELHFGSLLAAMASYADARHFNGQWLLRIDDIDQARVVADSDQHILSTLEQCGFEWDESVSYQSQNLKHYKMALKELHQLTVTYLCSCSRKQIQAALENSHIKNGIYPGTCRHKTSQADHQQNRDHAIRLKVSADEVCFVDLIQGEYSQNLQQDIGDFIIYRKDQVFSYQLSVVIDDFQSQITHIVRGYDLLDSTPRQIYLQQLLGYPVAQYAHIPLAVTEENLKLSKLSQAKKVDCNLETLVQAARFLGQNTLDTKDFDNKSDFWQYLVTNWDINKVPRMEKQMIMV